MKLALSVVTDKVRTGGSFFSIAVPPARVCCLWLHMHAQSVVEGWNPFHQRLDDSSLPRLSVT